MVNLSKSQIQLLLEMVEQELNDEYGDHLSKCEKPVRDAEGRQVGTCGKFAFYDVGTKLLTFMSCRRHAAEMLLGDDPLDVERGDWRWLRLRRVREVLRSALVAEETGSEAER